MPNLLSLIAANETLTDAEKVGQLFMPAAFINDTEAEITALEKLIGDYHVGGLCFFHSRASAATNFEGKKKIVFNQNSFITLQQLIARYQNASKYPLLISIDAEWGLAMRIENTPQYAYAITLGAMQGHDKLIFEVGKNIAKDCKAAGIHWNLAPVVDINHNPDNPVIGYRSFGEQRDLVYTKALAYLKGVQSEGVLTSLKHFPGHGDTATDSHLDLPLIQKSKTELWDNELYPFRKLIAHGVDSVMVGHLSVPSLTLGSTASSSISKDIIKGVLRSEMNFDGVVISDALNMHAVSKAYPQKGTLEWLAFDAGNDVLCFSENVPEGIAAILQHEEPKAINNSFERVWKLKQKAFQNVDKNQGSLTDPSALNKKIAAKSLTVYQDFNRAGTAFTSGKFLGISMGKEVGNHFFEGISTEFTFDYYSTKNSVFHTLQERLLSQENVLLALFPPKVKPQNCFDFSEEELALIQHIIKTKNTVLYLFGNPYLLQLFPTDKIGKIVIVYQDFEAFQYTAANHFLGKTKAEGKIPVTLKHQ